MQRCSDYNWLALYIAINYHEELTIEASLSAAYGEKILSPSVQLKDIQPYLLSSIFRRLSHPKFSNFEKASSQFRLNECTLIELYLFIKEVIPNMSARHCLTQEQTEDILKRYQNGTTPRIISEQAKLDLHRVIDILSESDPKEFYPKIGPITHPKTIQNNIDSMRKLQKAFESLTIGDHIGVELSITKGKRTHQIKKKGTVVFTNKSFVTLRTNDRMVTVTISDVIENKAKIFRII